MRVSPHPAVSFDSRLIYVRKRRTTQNLPYSCTGLRITLVHMGSLLPSPGLFRGIYVTNRDFVYCLGELKVIGVMNRDFLCQDARQKHDEEKQTTLTNRVFFVS